MKKLPQISDTEWQVMKVIWAAASPITANQVIENLESTTNWKPKTIKTLIARLLKKNAIGFSKEGREYYYSPLVSEKECMKAESQSFLKKVYGGALDMMFANFLEEQKLSKKEIEDLKRLLDEKSPRGR